MKFVGQESTESGKCRFMECECGHRQGDYSNRHVQEIRCNSCGRVGIEHDRPPIDTRSAEYDFTKHNGVDAPKDYK